MSYFKDHPEESYPYRVRYVLDDKTGYLEEYSLETGDKIKYDITKCTGSIFFTIEDLRFANKFISSFSRYTKNSKHTVTNNETCLAYAKFGVIGMRKPPSFSYLGTDKEIEEITIKIEATENDDDVGLNSYCIPESSGGFFQIQLRIKKSFFQNMKELVFSGKLESIVLEVDAFDYDGIYTMDFTFGCTTRVLVQEDMVDNKEDLHELYNSHDSRGYEERWSKDFTLHLNYLIKNFPFESND